VETARGRVTELHSRGLTDAYLYGADDSPETEIAGGLGAFFLLTEPPERFGLPAQAESPAQENMPPATAAGLLAAGAAVLGTLASFVVAHRGRSGR
jgi:formate dehydrogenase iron-sulfur subunit